MYDDTVYGPAPGNGPIPSGSAGASSGTAQATGVAIRAVKSPAGETRCTVNTSPCTLSPATCRVLPAAKSAAPTMSANRLAFEECARGSSTRSRLCAKTAAVTGWFDGGANRKPGRTRKTYVRPSGEGVGTDSATSGTSCAPAAPASSG